MSIRITRSTSKKHALTVLFDDSMECVRCEVRRLLAQYPQINMDDPVIWGRYKDRCPNIDVPVLPVASHIAIVASPTSDTFMELLMAAIEIDRNNANTTMNIIIPYYCYGTDDNPATTSDAITRPSTRGIDQATQGRGRRTAAVSSYKMGHVLTSYRALQMIQTLLPGVRMYIGEPHSLSLLFCSKMMDLMTGLIERIIVDVKTKYAGKTVRIAVPDEGARKRYAPIVRTLKLELATIMSKDRSHACTSVVNTSVTRHPDEHNSVMVFVDDLGRSMGTMLGAISAYRSVCRSQGFAPSPVIVAVAHVSFTDSKSIESTIDAAFNSGDIVGFYTTDSNPRCTDDIRTSNITVTRGASEAIATVLQELIGIVR